MTIANHPTPVPPCPPAVEPPKTEFLDIAAQVVDRTSRLWRLKPGSFWTMVIAPKKSYPVQGWKLHVSAHHGNAAEILRRVMTICIDSGAAFKFASDRAILTRLLSKNCQRSQGGKFITIYPADAEQCSALGTALTAALQDQDGPYILSDRQFPGSNVVFYRYGGFAAIHTVDVYAKVTSNIYDGKYRPVEDRRDAKFHLPDFAEPLDLPPAPDDDAAPAAAPADSLFDEVRFHSAFKHTNAGGVYLAHHSGSDRACVVKEARPFIGDTPRGGNAIENLKKEYDILGQLADLDVAPQPLKYSVQWRHHYMVQTFIDGVGLRKLFGTDNLLLRGGCDAGEISAWFDARIKIAIKASVVLQQIHARGIVFGDLSLNNILYVPEADKVYFIDFEGSFRAGIDQPTRIFTAGFRAPERLNADCALCDDIYALGAMLFCLVCPNVPLTRIKPSYPQQYLGDMVARQLIPAWFASLVLAILQGQVETAREVAERLGAGARAPRMPAVPAAFAEELTAREILAFAAAQWRDDDDAEPPYGDPSARADTLDRGLLGIAYAWSRVHGAAHPTMDHVLSGKLGMAGALPGLLNGAAGVAWYAAQNGRRKLAGRALAHAKTHELLLEHASYGYGGAGYGMACLRCWQRFDDATFLNDATWMADALVATATWPDPQTCYWDKNPDGEPLVGMCHGPAGVALFLLYCHVVTGDAGYLRTGRAALHHDLACASEIQGALGFPKAASTRGGIIYPYYAYGSAGIAAVLARYFHVTRERWFADQYVRITQGVTQRYAINPGWESGLVGLGCCLLDGRRFIGLDVDADLAHILEGLKLLAIRRDEGVAFTTALPPEIRLDLATGSAGVALFLHWHHEGGDNPFLLVDELLGRA